MVPRKYFRIYKRIDWLQLKVEDAGKAKRRIMYSLVRTHVLCTTYKH